MKIHELIETLQQFPQEAEVALWVEEWRQEPIISWEPEDVAPHHSYMVWISS